MGKTYCTKDEYAEASKVIEELVKIKSHKFAKRYMGPDDIAQEIRIKCWNAIPTFDPERGQSLKTYLNVVTENFLRNLMRDKFATFNPPCKKKCDHYDLTGTPTDEAFSCPIFAKYIESYRRKCSVRMPSSVDSAFASSAEGVPMMQNDTKRIELDLSIRQVLADNHPKLLGPYQQLILGRKIPHKVKIQIQTIVKGIL